MDVDQLAAVIEELLCGDGIGCDKWPSGQVGVPFLATQKLSCYGRPVYVNVYHDEFQLYTSNKAKPISKWFTYDDPDCFTQLVADINRLLCGTELLPAPTPATEEYG